MELASLIRCYQDDFERRYGDQLLPGHRHAMTAILGCRTPQAGQVHWACHDCHQHQDHPLSCGHRSCPRCQNREATRWLDRQRAMATVFRARMLDGLNQAGLTIPDAPKQWVVDCRRVGRGEPALEYLSRYLYRGVIAERDILANRNGNVTFRYVEFRTGETRTRTLEGADFLWLILQHVLPRGFRRVRDYGFLHGNAKKLLALVQLILRVALPFPVESNRPKRACPVCGQPMQIVSVIRGHWLPG